MNNVITILVDSVYSKALTSSSIGTDTIPFIKSLRSDSLIATNVFSYGPYTDAATKALYTGTKTLDTYGYYFGINTAEYSHFKLFKEQGYETFGIYYPYYMLSDEVEKYIDHSIYTYGFEYKSVWGGKLEYYAKLKNTRPLESLEYDLLIDCMEWTFRCWFLFYENLNTQPGSDIIVKELLNPELKGGGEETLRREYASFSENKKAYMDEVLRLGMNHPLARINEYAFGSAADVDFLKKVYSENKAFFRKASRVNIARNLKNNPISIKTAVKRICQFIKTRDKSYLRYIGNYGLLLLYIKRMLSRSLKPKWKIITSLDKQTSALLTALDTRSSDKPFYASLHVLEPHNNISFFSYDTKDASKVKSELEYIAPIVNGCGKKFGGNLAYQLSFGYVDYCIKNLFSELEKRGLLENTTVMLVSDHGTSYDFFPTRTRVVNTFHTENYNVPLLIWSKNGMEGKAGLYTGAYTADDVYPTLCDIAGIKAPPCFKGCSILKNTMGRDYVITEYMGPGVPDMLQREVWLSVRNSEYVIAYKNPIDKPLDIDNPCCIYDLTHDPYEMKNAAETLKDNECINAMKQLANRRYCEIQKETDNFFSHFEKEKTFKRT